MLPVGISFYTFQTLSYTLDVYRKKIKADTSFLDIAVFVSFFPQLVAGPIVRAEAFLPQLKILPRINVTKVAYPFFLVIFGAFLKLVIGDNVATTVDSGFKFYNSLNFAQSWATVLGFSIQIYTDFCGYSLMAIGLAEMLGFSFPTNFKSPYAARGFSDFWRRWHITLSEWLRDYLYISLGGNKVSKIRNYFNLMLTMLLGGLWHGASSMFVLWGAMHGSLLCLEKALKLRAKRKGKPSFGFIKALVTYLFICLTWVPFRAENAHQAFSFFDKMIFTFQLTLKNFVLNEGQTWLVALAAMTFAIHYINRKNKLIRIIQSNQIIRSSLLVIMMTAIYFSGSSSKNFIYFQF